MYQETETPQNDVITDVQEVLPSDGQVVEFQPEVLPEPVLLPLTREEDTFALAVIEYSGNLAEAYRATFGALVRHPGAKARTLMQRANVAARIQELTHAISDNALISLGAHMVELAGIRDLAKAQGNLKVAHNCEKDRGVVAGFYKDMVGVGVKGKGGDNPMLVINIAANSVDMNV